jgi:hypothetical protein
MRLNFLMIGQSNMCDRGLASELPAFPNASRMFVYHRPQPLGVPEIDTPGTWAQAVDVVDPMGAPVGGAGALGLAFANRVADYFPSDEVGLVPRSLPGTEMDQWRKWNRKSGNYGMALQRAWWVEEEYGPIAGVLFWQGEGDTASSGDSAVWTERFGRMVSDIRVDLQNLNLPVVFVRLGDQVPSGYAYWNTVRAQQEQVRMKNVAMVSIDDINPNADKIHYGTAAYVAIGERMADTMDGLL